MTLQLSGSITYLHHRNNAPKEKKHRSQVVAKNTYASRGDPLNISGVPGSRNVGSSGSGINGRGSSFIRLTIRIASATRKYIGVVRTGVHLASYRMGAANILRL